MNKLYGIKVNYYLDGVDYDVYTLQPVDAVVGEHPYVRIFSDRQEAESWANRLLFVSTKEREIESLARYLAAGRYDDPEQELELADSLFYDIRDWLMCRGEFLDK